jgi:hypothetical protein
MPKVKVKVKVKHSRRACRWIRKRRNPFPRGGARGEPRFQRLLTVARVSRRRMRRMRDQNEKVDDDDPLSLVGRRR